jgi:hypothetical protein
VELSSSAEIGVGESDGLERVAVVPAAFEFTGDLSVPLAKGTEVVSVHTTTLRVTEVVVTLDVLAGPSAPGTLDPVGFVPPTATADGL